MFPSAAFSASALPTESMAGVISKQTTHPADGAMARPQAQVPAATSKTASSPLTPIFAARSSKYAFLEKCILSLSNPSACRVNARWISA